MSAHYPKSVVTSDDQRVYRIWCRMRERCSSSRSDSFKNYGAKGVSVCSEWSSFSAFRSWALSHGYCDGLTIERHNSEGNYEPSNCTWATRLQQSLNRSIVRKSKDGTPLCVIAERNGIPAAKYRNRVHRGWPPEAAATIPPQGLSGPRTRIRDLKTIQLGDNGLVRFQ